MLGESEELQEKRILIVDDDADLRAVLQTTLEAHGYSCIGAASVNEALRVLRAERPALVILDLEMPEANGVTFLKQAPDALPPTSGLPPVIVLSGFDNTLITNYALKKGAVSFIKKPYDSTYLLGMIDAFMER